MNCSLLYYTIIIWYPTTLEPMELIVPAKKILCLSISPIITYTEMD